MDNMERNKSNNQAVCIICGILTAFGIASSIISLVFVGNSALIVSDVANTVLAVLIGCYAFKWYKKPHGNIIKYIILIFAVTQFIIVYNLSQLDSPWRVVLAAANIGLCSYVAGRLHRDRQNVILMSIVCILILTGMIVDGVNGMWSIGGFSPLIIWMDIFVAYILRYKEHRQAGLADADR